MRTGFLETMAKEGLTDLAYFKYISPLTTNADDGPFPLTTCTKVLPRPAVEIIHGKSGLESLGSGAPSWLHRGQTKCLAVGAQRACLHYTSLSDREAVGNLTILCAPRER